MSSYFHRKLLIMKHLALIFCLVSPLLLAAQTDETAVVKPARKLEIRHEIGLNITDLATRLLREPSETDALAGANWAVGYKLFLGKWGVRTAARWAQTASLDDATGGNNNPQITQSSDRDLRLGLEYQLKIQRRWLASFAADGIYGWGDRTLKTFFTDVFGNQQSGNIGQTTKRIGGGGAVGIQFMFNERVGLGTEATCYWIRQDQTEENDFYLPFPEAADMATTDLNLRPPTSLYFFFRF